jgi:hypothetical protein
MQGGRAWGAPNSDLPITSFMGRKAFSRKITKMVNFHQ